MDKLYTPHGNQRLIHASKARYRTVVAGRRFGKSAFLLNEAISLALQVERQIAWIVLPLYRQAKEIYWIDPDITKYFMPYVQAGICKADKSELSLHFGKTNSWVRLKGSDNYDSLRGSGIDLIGWDEADDIKPEAFDIIEPALADSPDHRALYVGTPKGLRQLHEFSLKGDRKGVIPDFGKPVKKDEDWETWHFTSYDNLAWAEGSREREMFVKYIDKKRVEAEEKGKLPWFNQEYLASFEKGAGMFFPTWHYSTHVLQETLKPPEHTKIIETKDWGLSAPFAWHSHWVKKEKYNGINFNRIYTFAELYGTNQTPTDWAKRIIRERARFGILSDQVSEIFVDSTMNDRGDDGSISISTQFNQAYNRFSGYEFLMTGASRSRKNRKNRISRWASMVDWMRLAPDGKPYWIITKDCPNLIRTIPMMEPDEHDIEDMNTKLEDHAVDGASFGLNNIQFIDAKVEGVPRGGEDVAEVGLHKEKSEWDDEE